MEKMSHILNKYFLERREILDFFVYFFYKEWPHLLVQLMKRQKKYRALVLSFYDQSFALSQIDILNAVLGNMCTFELNDSLFIDVEKLAQSPFDIIISDFYLPQMPGKLVYNLETLPQIHHIGEIANYIRKLQKQGNIFQQ